MIVTQPQIYQQPQCCRSATIYVTSLSPSLLPSLPPSLHPSIPPSIPPSIHPSLHPSIPPSLPKALTVLLALTLSRDEVLWLMKHTLTPPPKGKHRPHPDDYVDSALPELLYYIVELKSEWSSSGSCLTPTNCTCAVDTRHMNQIYS